MIKRVTLLLCSLYGSLLAWHRPTDWNILGSVIPPQNRFWRGWIGDILFLKFSSGRSRKKKKITEWFEIIIPLCRPVTTVIDSLVQITVFAGVILEERRRKTHARCILIAFTHWIKKKKTSKCRPPCCDTLEVWSRLEFGAGWGLGILQLKVLTCSSTRRTYPWYSKSFQMCAWCR